MKLINIKTTDLIPYINNTRTHSEEQIKQVASSIKEFGFLNPVIIDKDNGIIAGHCRVLACEKLGIEEVPCIKVEHLTEAQKKAYIIADNKLAENAGWDEELLKVELESLKEMDFDIDLLGFDDEEFNNLLNIEEEKEIIEDEIPEVPEEPISKLGQIYQLGNHRLMCGDSTNEEDVKKLMNGKLADMVFTDPPYDMSMGGQGCFAKGMEKCKERLEKIINFDPYVINYLSSMKIGSYYICTSKDGIPKYLDMFKEHNFNILVWCKTNPTPFTSGTFLPDIEYIMYFSKKGEKIWNNSIKPTEIYKKYYISSKLQGRNDGGGDMHPTMKPLELITNKIKISSNINGIVLDIFGGSGSTLIACEQLDRKCYMMELDPKYIDVIIQRWENFTGQKAILLESA